jgi:large subunit ribosomal protein L4
MDITVFDLKGQRTGSLSLDDARWGGAPNLALLSQAVRMYRTNLRAGTASTKTRGDVSGGGKKPWKQKHTGRARAGSIRSPLWRGGGITFGPHPREFAYHMPKAMRRKALLESLKGKLRDEELVVLGELQASVPKTKPFAGLAKTFKVERSSLIVLEEFAAPIVKSLRNLASFTLCRADELNALDVLNAQKVLVTRAAFERVEHRVSGQGLPDNGSTVEVQPETPAASPERTSRSRKPARAAGAAKVKSTKASRKAARKPADKTRKASPTKNARRK